MSPRQGAAVVKKTPSEKSGRLSDEENRIGSDEPKLKRTLKARHLQMIAIGM